MRLFPSAQEFANQARGPAQNICNILHFTITDVYTPHPNPRLEDCPLFAVPIVYSIPVLVTTIQIWTPVLHRTRPMLVPLINTHESAYLGVPDKTGKVAPVMHD